VKKRLPATRAELNTQLDAAQNATKRKSAAVVAVGLVAVGVALRRESAAC